MRLPVSAQLVQKIIFCEIVHIREGTAMASNNDKLIYATAKNSLLRDLRKRAISATTSRE